MKTGSNVSGVRTTVRVRSTDRRAILRPSLGIGIIESGAGEIGGGVILALRPPLGTVVVDTGADETTSPEELVVVEEDVPVVPGMPYRGRGIRPSDVTGAVVVLIGPAETPPDCEPDEVLVV